MKMEFILNFWKNKNETFSKYNVSEKGASITAEKLSHEMTSAVLPVILLIGIEAVFGLVGNVFILIVYYKWYKMCSFRYFVLSMGVIDLTSSLTTLPGEIYSQVNWYSYPYDAVCKAKSFFNVFTVWSTGIILLLLAYDRYRKICYPLSWQIQVRTSARLCTFGILFAVVISSPTAVFWGKQSYVYIDRNISVAVSICEKADAYANDLVPFLYVLCALVLPLYSIIFVTAVFNVCTGRKLLYGLRKKNGGQNNVASQMLPPETDEDKSCQFSRQENDIERGREQLKRRFSFPAGKVSLKRSCLVRKMAHFRLTCSHLEQIAEDSYESNFDQKQNRSLQYLRKQVKLKRGKFFSETDVVGPQRAGSCLNHIRQRVNSRRRKTLIMLILTGVFIVTMSLYLGLVCKVAYKKGVLRELTHSQKVVFFFFWRLYFINTLINPLLYGFMDHRFRKGLVRLLCKRSYLLRFPMFPIQRSASHI